MKTFQRGHIVPLHNNGHNFPRVLLNFSSDAMGHAGRLGLSVACLALDSHGNLLGHTDLDKPQSADRAVIHMPSDASDSHAYDMAVVYPDTVDTSVAALYFGVVSPKGLSVDGVSSLSCTLSQPGENAPISLPIGGFTVPDLNGQHGVLMLGLLRGFGLWHAQVAGVPVSAATADQLHRISQECLLSLA